MDRPNLLLIWTDEQRADTLACYGNAFVRAPNLNRFAGGCFVFENAYCTMPVCTPARGSILTGLWPHAHGCCANNAPLAAGRATLAEMLGDGYRRAYHGKWHLGDEIFPQHGFAEWASIEDEYRAHYSRPADRAKRSDYHRYLLGQGFAPDQDDGAGGRVFSRTFAAKLPAEHTKAAFLGRRAEEFLRGSGGGAPWMLSVNFLEPHMPFCGPYDSLHDPAALPAGPAFLRRPTGPVPLQKSANVERFAKEGFEGNPLKTEADWRRLRAQYYGLVTLVDEAVGRILAALEESGQAGNTIVVFTSDHGEMMGDHACLTKGVMYEEAIRIPLLVRVPWLSRGQVRVPGSLSQVDLAPTLLELMGRRVPGHLQGRSRAGVLAGRETLEGNDAVVEWSCGRRLWRTILSGDGGKLSLCADDQCEFFDLRADPHEMRNLFEEKAHRPRIRDLARRLAAWQRATGDACPLPAV
jgi:arylsulfatase A-like enzyme